MVVIGVTGMIAAGKSTVSNMIGKKYDAVVFDADITAKQTIKELDIDNSDVINNPMKLYKIEQQIIPSFVEKMTSFIEKNKKRQFVVMDIALLYEFNLEKYCDKVINVYCNFDTRVKRIQSRPHMNIEKFMFLNNKQMKDKERNSRADYTINTEESQELVAQQLDVIIDEIEKSL